MKVTLLQTDIKWADPDVNVARVDAAIDRNPGSDIYFLPEMWTTGFVTNPEGLAETMDSASIQWMKDKARETDAAICGSIAIKEDGKHYNRSLFVEPDGKVTQYDKAHLFMFSEEVTHYTPGTKLVVVKFRGVRILLQVCYDLRFPMWSRNFIDDSGQALYDLVIYSANWPDARMTAWHTLTRARAIENQCYVAAVNRCGTDDWGVYSGDTALIHPYGHEVARCELGKVCETTGEVDMEALNRYRTKFPVLKDIIWTKDYS